MKIAVFLCEDPSKRYPARLPLSLLASHLRESGHEVCAHQIRPRTFDLALQEQARADFRLVVLDSVCPIELAEAAWNTLGAPQIWVGENALGRLERSPAEFGMITPNPHELIRLCDGIEAHRRLLSQPIDSREPGRTEAWFEYLASIAGLFFRRWDLLADRSVGQPIDSGNQATRPGREHPAEGLYVGRSGFPPPGRAPHWQPTPKPSASDTTESGPVEVATHQTSLRPIGLDPPQHRCPLEADDRLPARYTPRGLERLGAYVQPNEEAGRAARAARPGSEDQDLGSFLRQQIEWLWPAGARVFAIGGSTPISAYNALLGEWDRLEPKPREIQIRPEVRSLKAEAAKIGPVLGRAAERGLRTRIAGVGFDSFVGRTLDLLGHQSSHWENRWAARLLQRLGALEDASLACLHGHRLLLFDPWTTLDELLTNLSAVDEDAPFLKDAVHLDACFRVESADSEAACRIRDDGLLRYTSTGSGFAYEFADPQIPLYRDLAARGIAPLMEAIGRIRVPGQTRESLIREGRFRWFRSLARYLQRSRGSERRAEDGWGQVLAAVVRELGIHPTDGHGGRA